MQSLGSCVKAATMPEAAEHPGRVAWSGGGECGRRELKPHVFSGKSNLNLNLQPIKDLLGDGEGACSTTWGNVHEQLGVHAQLGIQAPT